MQHTSHLLCVCCSLLLISVAIVCICSIDRYKHVQHIPYIAKLIICWLSIVFTLGRRKRRSIIRWTETENCNSKSHLKESSNSFARRGHQCTWYRIRKTSSSCPGDGNAREDSHLDCPQIINYCQRRYNCSCRERKSCRDRKASGLTKHQWILSQFVYHAKHRYKVIKLLMTWAHDKLKHVILNVSV